MTDEEFVLSLLGVIGGFAVLFTVMWAVWQWIQPRRGLEAKEVLALREELRALREGQEAIAVEIERVSEGQRFVTTVLAEQRKAGARLGAGESP